MDPKNNIDRQGHWENVYSTKSEQEVSWFQDNPEPSLDLIAIAGGNRDSRIIDIGGGASRLVDTLLADGYKDITVLDLSAAALEVAKKRLGRGAAKAAWVAADVTRWIPERTYDIWHDRAAFHFLSEPDDQAAYVERLRKALRQGGHAVIGTFAPDGPERCSGLPVLRHDAASLGQLLGHSFELIESKRHDHQTPARAIQKFQFSLFQHIR